MTTDTGGNAAFSIPFAAPGGAILTSTATLALSTSHFSACWVAPVAPYYTDNGVFTAQATVTDDDGLSDAVSFTVTVTNAVPVADAGAPLVVFEGATVTHDASFTDPGTADTHTALVDWGDATVAAATVDQGPGTTSATRTFDDEGGPFTLTLTVTDDDGGVGTDTTTITVLNSTPVVVAGANLLVNASDVIDTQITTFTDAGVLDTHTATVDWGDGTALATGTVDQGAGTVDGSHIYNVEGTYTVTVTVTDYDGGVDSATFEVVVVVDTPVVDAGVDLSVEEGSSLLLSFSFVDAASETHDATVVWGDGATTTATVNQSLDTGSATHTYDDQGVFIAQASVTDDTGKSGLDTLTITVSNATPVVVAGANLVVSVSTVSDEVLATFTDAGVLDTHTATIDWGDGTPLATGTVDAGSVRGSHSYGFYGLYTVTVTVTDNDGGSGSTTVSAQVYNIPAVPSITAWGMALSAVLLAMVYWWAMRRRPLIQARRQ
ncbi:MAG: PKD domain-containing protein [Chloroflexi bacterium]|nr:PKD domain-containing protein [Chloroflexota bacterium]MDA1174263.1 PKD domain-containing protein [Chloroflexota bacterium]